MAGVVVVSRPPRGGDAGEAEDPRVPLALYGTAAVAGSSDIPLWYFLLPYARVLRASPLQMGLISSARDLFQNVLQTVWGPPAERLGRRPFVAVGYLSSGCLVATFLLLRSPLQLLALLVLQSVLWSAAVPAWSSLLGDYTRKETRGRGLGRIGAVSQFSGVAATLFVAVAAYTAPGELTPSSFVVPFLLSAGAGLLTAVLVLFVKEAKAVPRGRVGVLEPLRDRDFRVFLAASGAWWFAMSLAWPLFPYVTVDVVHATVWQIALISTASGLLTSLAQPGMGSIADRTGRKPLLVASRASYFLYPLLYAFARNWLQLLAIEISFTASLSAVTVSSTAYILDSAPEGQRAVYAAANNLVFGLAAFLGATSGGALTHLLSITMGMGKAVFTGLIASAALRLAASAGFLAIKETLPGKR